MQVALLSLDIYNDVHCSAVPAQAAQHLAGEAQADAELCMRKLITNLATEVSTIGSIGSMHFVLKGRHKKNTLLGVMTGASVPRSSPSTLY